jgi:hypothetical protein
MHLLRRMMTALLLAQTHRDGNKSADFLAFNWRGRVITAHLE